MTCIDKIDHHCKGNNGGLQLFYNLMMESYFLATTLQMIRHTIVPGFRSNINLIYMGSHPSRFAYLFMFQIVGHGPLMKSCVDC